LTLKHHPDGPFMLSKWSWENIGGTSCFKIHLSEKDVHYELIKARNLLNRKDNTEGDEILPLIIKSNNE
jgi:hypothetical protein